MQAIKKKHRAVSQPTRGGIDTRTKPLRYSAWNSGEVKTDTPQGGDGNGFLNCEFHDIVSPEMEYQRNETLSSVLSFNVTNTDFLYNSALNYCHLLGKKFDPELTGKYYDDLIRIYNEFDRQIPDKYSLNFDVVDNELYFVIYANSDFPNQFVFLPIKNIELMEPKMAKIFKQFVSYYSKSQGILFHGQHMDIDYIVDVWFGEILEYSTEYDEEDIRVAKMYTEGKIPDLFNEISRISITPGVLEKECKAIYNEVSSQDQELLNIILKGIPLLSSQRMDSFSYRPDEQNISYDNGSVEFERILAIIWDEDYLWDQLVRVINSELGEFGGGEPVQCMRLDPSTEELLQISDYPMKFYDWFIELIEKINKYEPAN